MNTLQHLNSLGVTMAQARSFIMENMDKPATIYNAAKQYKIDSQMLAEIVAPQFPGIKAADVEKFFTHRGMNGEHLNTAVLNPVKSWQGDSPIRDHIAFNNHTGTLSTESMRENVVAKVGYDNYIKTFSPKYLPGAADGVLSTSDLGFSYLGEIEATWQNMESLFYGTMIDLLGSISVSEFKEWVAFNDKNSFWLSINHAGTVAKQKALLMDFMLDPVTASDPCVFNDADMAMAVHSAVLEQVKLVGINPEYSLFGGLGA